MGGSWAKDSTDLELLAIVIRTYGPSSIWQHEIIPIRVICGCTDTGYIMADMGKLKHILLSPIITFILCAGGYFYH